MGKLVTTFRRAIEQGFLPIFTATDHNSIDLVEACVQAGCTTIEYTLRRPDAAEMIPIILKEYPALTLFVGSTLDSEAIVAQMRKRFPQLRTIPELMELDIAGMVSMLGWSDETIRRYKDRIVIAPLASTATEALRMMNAGAHIIKMNGSDLSLVKTSRADATFDFCPIFVTGGMTVERIPLAVESGAVLIGSGFDLLLKDMPINMPVPAIAERIRAHIDATLDARRKKFPTLFDTRALSDEAFLAALPFYSPLSLSTHSPLSLLTHSPLSL